MKRIVNIILTTLLLSLPLSASAQGVVTRPQKTKKQTTAPEKKNPKKRQQQKPTASSTYSPQINAEDQLTPEQMLIIGDDAFDREIFTEAAKWYRKSAERGNSDAQYKLGCLYFTGKGVEQDYSQAVKWFRMSAVQGNDVGQCYLGLMYAAGCGVEQSDSEAKRWYQKSADQGNTVAKTQLERF